MFGPPSSSPVRAATAAVAAGLIGLPAVFGVLGGGPLPKAAAAPAAAAAPVSGPASDTAPLAVAIESLTPSTLPRRGRIRVTGSVTNRDERTWSLINLYAFVSGAPMTSRSELAEAASVVPEQPVGDRIGEPGTFDSVGDLAPGETAQFAIRVARDDLPATVGARGVYWFGVHALGETEEGRDTVADGRARTFLPLVTPERARRVQTALVLPLRHPLTRAADGSLADVEGWTRALSTDGRLRSLVELGAAAGSRPLTWLVDPALPDAVRRLAAGNPARSLEPTPAEGEGPDDAAAPQIGGDPEDSGSPDPSTSSGEDDADDPTDPDPATRAAAEAGSDWLNRLRAAVAGDQVLTLPYGDLDVAGAAAHAPELYRRARNRPGTELGSWGVPVSPALAPPAGYLDRDAIRLARRSDTLLVTDELLRDGPADADADADADAGPDAPPAVARVAGRRLVLSSSEAARGGPGPDDPLSAINLRQRILGEAALRLLAPGRAEPLVVVLPAGLDPAGAVGFFEGLDVDWLELGTVAEATDRRAVRIGADALEYPDRQRRRELDAASFDSATALVRTGESLQNVLTLNDRVATVLADQALAGASYSSRAHPRAARASLDRSRRWVEGLLGSIRVSAPRGVTLSSGSGSFAATVQNGLDQPVSVTLDTLAGGALRISGPRTIDVAAGGSATVLLDARAARLGVHNVTLLVTDSDGTPLGSSDAVPIRVLQVSNVIWVIMGTGAALLFGAIILRLLRRLRSGTGSDPAGPDHARKAALPT